MTQRDYTQRRIQYWEEFAGAFERWEAARAGYQSRLASLYGFLIPPGRRVLEVGCGQGDLLAACRPRTGVGIDFSPAMVQRARRRHPHLEFHVADAHGFDLQDKFDYVICSDLVNDLWDAQGVFECIRRHAGPSTRLILNTYSRMWELPRRLAETVGLARPQLPQNWFTVEDLANVLALAGFEVVRTSQEILWPVRTPLVAPLCNRYLVKLWPWRVFGLTNMLVARPQPAPPSRPAARVSVVVAARNEAGNIAEIFERLPAMGAGTELIFVEGHSTDDTWQTIEREMARHPGVPARLFKQTGKGKGDAVRKGFAEAEGDLLVILDADLSVAPEDLPRFYEAWHSGKADFVNGVRLVYPMEERAMRFLNQVGNKFFSLAFSWLLGQSIKDTLCGSKAISREDYTVIAANRAYFGEFDPFGDFDLLFGASKYNLKILDLPIRYRERRYGITQIQRWRHGLLLLRMTLYALGRIKFV